ncbi:Hsp20/alpha crystallin family protein [Catenuloplanes indicus]|uniref:HSP20 family protein n=1 Tax=Catenuloplanes indicus TaxID=137267 RepID=A0AAE3VTS3_9ACTN|nr:Hsp20/alpha crystallin family protein [Catenuloplanes indicus]MDQ0363566.1 HSP20 family protein [Catenuloplanes indicus]
MSTLTPLDLLRWSWSPFPGPGIRIEEHLDGDRFVVRAELPGVDPGKDVEVTLSGEVLKIKVERKESFTGKAHSEFHYGSFYRTVPVPPGLRPDTVDASYQAGILTISALIAENQTAGKPIPIKAES